MAVKITRWDVIKIILCVLDIIILFVNLDLLLAMIYKIYTEYNSRGTLNLFFTPTGISIFNFLIDGFMNVTNFKMKYAGHNRYGMIIRFFMFYSILIIVIYTCQREKYIVNTYELKDWIFYGGLVNILCVIISMILGFFVIDIQNVSKVFVKKTKEEETINILPRVSEL